MSYVYDGILVLAFALIVWRGWRRGLLSTLLSLAGWVVALFIIFGFGTKWADTIYTGTVEPWAVKTVEKAIPEGTENAINSGADAVEKVQGVLDQLGGLLGGRDVTRNQASEIANAMRQNNQDLAEGITDTVLRPVLKKVVETVVYLVILIIVLLLFRMLSRMAIPKARGNHGVLSRTNQLLGAVLGVLEGAGVILILAHLIFRLSVLINTDWLNDTLMSRTVLLKFLIFL